MEKQANKRRRLPYTLYSILLAAVLVVGASVFGGAITLSNTDGYINVSSCVNVTNGSCTINYNLSRYSSNVRDGILSSADWIRFNSTSNISNSSDGNNYTTAQSFEYSGSNIILQTAILGRSNVSAFFTIVGSNGTVFTNGRIFTNATNCTSGEYSRFANGGFSCFTDSTGGSGTVTSITINSTTTAVSVINPTVTTNGTVVIDIRNSTLFADGLMTAAQATQLNNLNNSNTSTNERLTAVNATAVAKASPGNCVGANSTHVNVTMNTTTSGVQCVAVSLHSTPQVANASLNMTSGFLPVASANNASVLNNSVVFQNETRIGIGTTATPNILNVQAGNVQGITINSSNSGIIDINTVFTNGSNFRIATQFNARNLFEILSSTSPALAPTTNRLTINGSNGNVGIGEIFPFSRLSVNGGVSIGDVAYTRTAAPTNGLIVGGNVGINNTSPNRTLSVTGVANVNGSLCINDDCRTGWFVDTGLRTNITDLQTSNTSANTRITSVNATAVAKASPGDCVGANSTHVNVTMNTTTSGVQCVAVSLNPGSGTGNVSGFGNGTGGFLARWTNSTSLNTSSIRDTGALVVLSTPLQFTNSSILFTDHTNGALQYYGFNTSINYGLHVDTTSMYIGANGGDFWFRNVGRTSSTNQQRIKNGGMELVDGTVSAPSFSFVQQGTAGLYRVAPSQVGVSAGGVLVANFTNNATQLAGNISFTTISGAVMLMTNTSTRNIGINTTSPNATLHVVGVANVNGSLCINDDCRTGWFVDTGLRTNITDLQTSNTSANTRITSVNATAVAKASPGDCVGANSTHVNVTMNTTTSGVQCVAVSLNPGAGGGGGGYDDTGLRTNISNLQTSNTSTNTRINTINQTTQDLTNSNTSTNTRINTINASKGNLSMDSNGTAGYLAQFTNTANVNNSALYQNSTGALMIGGTAPNATLHVIGSANISTTIYTTQICLNSTCHTAINNNSQLNPVWSMKLLDEEFTQVSTIYGFMGGLAISGGSNAMLDGQIMNPGILSISDGLTAGAGYFVRTAVNALLMNVSDNFTAVIRAPGGKLESTVIVNGFFDSGTNENSIVDGCYMIYNLTPNNQNVYGRCKTNSVITSTSTNYTAVNNTWFTISGTLNNIGTNFNFTVRNGTGTILWSDNISSNIPTSSVNLFRQTGAGIMAYQNSTDAASVIAHVDYFSWGSPRILNRY